MRLRASKAPGRASKGGQQEEDRVLDEEEQDRVVAEMRKDVERQIGNARKYFYGLLLALCVIMLTCLVYSTLHPFEMEHQAHFKEHVPHWAFQLYYFVSSLCFLLAALTAKRGHQNTPVALKATSVVIALVASLFWFVVFYHHGVTIPQLYWLPLANPLGIFLAVYLDRDAESLLRQVETLEGSKYQHKSI